MDQEGRQGVVLPLRQQGLGGAPLGVRVHEEHPLPVLGGQEGRHVDGRDGLSHAALQVYNGYGFHYRFSSQWILNLNDSRMVCPLTTASAVKYRRLGWM